MADDRAAAKALVPKFKYERLLSQDQAGRRIVLLGQIDSKPAILTAERAAFSVASQDLESFPSTVDQATNLGANDIYFWYLARTVSSQAPPDLKLNLIYPCTEKHIKKYSAQGTRIVTETPEIYRTHVRSYIEKCRGEGRLHWVWNIIEGRTEREDVIHRTDGPEGFLLLPDLNWDRKTVSSMHLLGLMVRRDIWSVRDLTKAHITWLKHMREKLLAATVGLYPELEEDQLKLYVHYHPTYYHFHIHIVHVSLEAGGTQAVGKALGLENIISTLEHLDEKASSMADVSLTFHLGEASELWTEVYEPLKRQRLAARDG